jgi:hypothetical protein
MSKGITKDPRDINQDPRYVCTKIDACPTCQDQYSCWGPKLLGEPMSGDIRLGFGGEINLGLILALLFLVTALAILLA